MKAPKTLFLLPLSLLSLPLTLLVSLSLGLSYPLVYFLALTPAILAYTALYGFHPTLIPYTGFSVVQLLVGLLTLPLGFRFNAILEFYFLSLLSHLVALHSLYSTRRALLASLYTILALATLTWTLESYKLMAGGYPIEFLTSRYHLVLLAITALMATFTPESLPLTRLIATLGVLTPVALICLIQSGFIAGEVYGGSVELLIPALYIAPLAYTLLGLNIKSYGLLVPRAEGLVLSLTLLAGYTLLLLSTLLESLGYIDYTIKAKTVHEVSSVAYILVVLVAGLIAGSRLGALGASLLAWAIPRALENITTTEVLTATIAGYMVALASIAFTARRSAKLWLPILLVPLAALAASQGLAYHTITDSTLIQLNSTRALLQGLVEVSVGELKVESVSEANSSGELSIKGLIPVLARYAGLNLSIPYAFEFRFVKGEGWVFEAVRVYSFTARGDIVRVYIEPAPSLTASLQSAYFTQIATGELRLRQEASLLITITLYRGLLETMKSQLYMLAPAAIGLILVSGVYERVVASIKVLTISAKTGGRFRLKAPTLPLKALLIAIAVIALVDALTLYVSIAYGPFPAFVELGAPTAYRNLYVHVPLGIASYALFTIAFISALLFIAFRVKNAERVAHASIALGVVYGIMAWITGTLWAGESWGGYWTWDPRQTGILLMVLAYLVYFVIRMSIKDPDVSARISMVYAIAAFVSIPLSFILPYIMPSLHPTVSETRAFVVHPIVKMLFPIRLITVLTLSLLLLATLTYRYLGVKVSRYIALLIALIPLASLIASLPLAQIATVGSIGEVAIGSPVKFRGVVVEAKLLDLKGDTYTVDLTVASGAKRVHVIYEGSPPVNPPTVKLDNLEVVTLTNHYVVVEGVYLEGFIKASSISIYNAWCVNANALIYGITLLLVGILITRGWRVSG